MTEIRKMIHQTWKTDVVPDKWIASPNRCKELIAEGWEYKLWTDADNRALIERDFPWFLEKYDGYKYGIQRADAIRSFILYSESGYYMDLDIIPKDNFTAFHEMYKHHGILLPGVKNGNGFFGQGHSNCFMASSKHHPFWPVVWERLKNPLRDAQWWKKPLVQTHYFRTIFLTGPGIISDSVRDYKKQTGQRVLTIPAQLIQPGRETDDNPVSTPESVVATTEGESWQRKDADFWRGLGLVANHAIWIVTGLMLIFMITTIVGFVLLKRANQKLNTP